MASRSVAVLLVATAVLAAVPLSCLASLGTTVWPHPSSMSLVQCGCSTGLTR